MAKGGGGEAARSQREPKRAQGNPEGGQGEPTKGLMGGQEVAKGAEKGYFAFGGSSTLLLFEPNSVTLANDLLESSHQMIEHYAKVGTKAGYQLEGDT